MKTFLGLTFTFDQFKEFLQNKNSIIKKKFHRFIYLFIFVPLKHPASVTPNINLLSTKKERKNLQKLY